jgi:hypothetical protein
MKGLRIKRPEVNQTKPELAAEGSEICADSAGYAPQALVPLYDVIELATSSGTL